MHYVLHILLKQIKFTAKITVINKKCFLFEKLFGKKLIQLFQIYTYDFKF